MEKSVNFESFAKLIKTLKVFNFLCLFNKM